MNKARWNAPSGFLSAGRSAGEAAVSGFSSDAAGLLTRVVGTASPSALRAAPVLPPFGVSSHSEGDRGGLPAPLARYWFCHVSFVLFQLNFLFKLILTFVEET